MFVFAADGLAGGVVHQNVAREAVFAGTAHGEAVLSVFADAAAVDVDFRTLRGVDGCHENL